MPAFSGPYHLSDRQRRLYNVLVRVFKSTPANTSRGDATRPAVLRWDQVPCYRAQRASLDQPTTAGRVVPDSRRDVHVYQFPEQLGGDLSDGDYIVDVTLTPEGTPSVTWGRVWRVRGPAITQLRRVEFDAGLTTCDANVVAPYDVPTGVGTE